jgi:hypothetical protein
MPDDGNGSWWQKMWAIGAGTSAPRADPVFDKESAAELARRLGERAARQATIDPAVAARERRAALDAWDRARVHRQKVMAGGAAGVLAVAVLAWLVVSNLWLPEAPSVSAVASAEPAPRIASAAAAPVSPAPEPAAPRLPPSSPEQTRPSPTASLPVTPAATPVATPAASPAPPATVPAPPETASRSTPSPAPALGVDEVREVQTRLLGLGFNPGPIDGATGRMTTAAAMRYQQERSLEQTGKVDRSLLEQLRQDPNPQIAQPAPPPAAPRANSRAGRPDGRTSRTTAQRDPGPFDRMGRWLDSLTR